ncbi:alpha/beta fold hydrolase [Longivirga aurantiaca]|uniref:Alpha/beta fold hydrolase n=1 Tax=Longivirga aurantiaca TaxID=1837743 RepID=A0ABW1T231_9ACTN
MSDVLPGLVDDDIALPGFRMALRRAPGERRPFLLVHGLASNARLWDGVARRLAAAGHEVVAVDQRGHGRSEETVDGYDTSTAACDLSDLIAALGWTGDRAPVVAGQSWGGNVVLTLAAEHRGVGAIALVDGGWIHLSDRFPTFDECWEQLAPPVFDGWTRASLEERARSWNSDWPEEGRLGALANFGDLPDGTVRPHLAREHHRSIVHSLWQDDPRPLYPRVQVPTLLMAAVDAVPLGSTPVTEALDRIPDAEVQWYVGAHHDLHAQQPDRCTADLLALEVRARP